MRIGTQQELVNGCIVCMWWLIILYSKYVYVLGISDLLTATEKYLVEEETHALVLFSSAIASNGRIFIIFNQ